MLTTHENWSARHNANVTINYTLFWLTGKTTQRIASGRVLSLQEGSSFYSRFQFAVFQDNQNTVRGTRASLRWRREDVNHEEQRTCFVVRKVLINVLYSELE